jgi:hypothetical protein
VNDPSLSNSLVDLAARIRTEHNGAQAAVKRGIEHVIAAGELLIEAKAQLKHGQWLPWLEEHCGLSDRTASRYMRVARNKDKLGENGHVSDLSLRGAVDALTAHIPPDVSEELAKANSKCVELWIEDASRRYPHTAEAFANGFADLPKPVEVLEVFETAAADFMRPLASIRESSTAPGYYDVFYLDGCSEIVTGKLGWIDNRPRPIVWELLPAWLVIASHGKLSPDRWRTRQVNHWQFKIFEEFWEAAQDLPKPDVSSWTREVEARFKANA